MKFGGSSGSQKCENMETFIFQLKINLLLVQVALPISLLDHNEVKVKNARLSQLTKRQSPTLLKCRNIS